MDGVKTNLPTMKPLDYLWLLIPAGIIALYFWPIWYYWIYPEALETAESVEYHSDGTPCIQEDYGRGGAFAVPC